MEGERGLHLFNFGKRGGFQRGVAAGEGAQKVLLCGIGGRFKAVHGGMTAGQAQPETGCLFQGMLAKMEVLVNQCSRKRHAGGVLAAPKRLRAEGNHMPKAGLRAVGKRGMEAEGRAAQTLGGAGIAWHGGD